MICKYCGNVIDDNSAVCPYCGTAAADDSAYAAPKEVYGDGAYSAGGYDSGAYDDGASAYQSEAYYDGAEGYTEETAPAKKLNVKLPNISASTIISIACAIFSFICLVMVSSLKGDIGQSTKTVMNGLNAVSANVASIEERISGLDSTVANVQQNAYNQLASQTINLTKDLMPLTGPVTLNKTAQMFIVRAKGALSVNSSFVWQKYNEATSGWVDIVFTGANTVNEQYGLRLENKISEEDRDEYESILWASGITKAAEGTYRCVIKDTNGITKNSSEATVSVTDTAA